MTETLITPQQKKYLRGISQKLTPAVSVGKAGMTEAVLARISQLLEQHEMIKVRLSADDRKEAAAAIGEATEACCVSIVGRAAVFYKPNTDLPPKKRIHLPR